MPTYVSRPCSLPEKLEKAAGLWGTLTGRGVLPKLVGSAAAGTAATVAANKAMQPTSGPGSTGLSLPEVPKAVNPFPKLNKVFQGATTGK